jgi:hypothetical protein
MTWSHIQKRIASALQEGRVAAKLSKNKVERAEQGYLHIWPPDPGPPLWVLTNYNPILAGAGSVFNLSGSMDAPIVGLMQPGISSDEALELLPFYVEQAERILDQTDKMVSIAALMQRVTKQGETDQEKIHQNPKRVS